MTEALSSRRLLAYALLHIPITFAALPLFVQAPKFYASEMGLSLTTIGAIIIAVRIIDGIQDPFIGYLGDYFNRSNRSRYRFIAWCAPLLAASFAMLFMPPAWTGAALAVWFAVSLTLVSTFYGCVSITYNAAGAEISDDYHERTRISAYRESCGLLGVLLASALPQWWMQSAGALIAYERLSLLLAVLLAAFTLLLLLAAPPPRHRTHRTTLNRILSALWRRLREPKFVQLLAVYMLHGIAASIPASLVLFYIDDILQAGAHSGYFLAVYFLSGALGMGVWNALSRRTSKRTAWLAAMGVSALTFAQAFFLGAGDIGYFYAVCIASGLGLGANLVLPVSILADIISPPGSAGSDTQAASYMGLWSLAGKLCLGLAAGITLPLLAYQGYAPGPGNTAESLRWLSASYTLLPCAVQVLAMVFLWILPIDKTLKKGDAI